MARARIHPLRAKGKRSRNPRDLELGDVDAIYYVDRVNGRKYVHDFRRNNRPRLLLVDDGSLLVVSRDGAPLWGEE